MTKTKTPSKRTLNRAAKLLQAAHDHIELYGFDINVYGDSNRSDFVKGEPPPPMCYIGTVRFHADVHPRPGSDYEDPAAGDGPELGVALAAMDKIALRRLRLEVKDEYTHTTGRFVEHLGFEIRKRAEKRFPLTAWIDWDQISAKRQEYERDYALKLLRQALTEIYS